jgi:ankyrin repeat protein
VIASIGLCTATCYQPDHTRLTRAVLMGDLHKVRSLVLAEKVDPDERGVAGWTPLTLAIAHRHRDIAKLLIEAGASVDRPKNSWTWDTDGTEPLGFAAANGETEIARMLLERGAEVDDRDMQEKATALMRAARSGTPADVELLIAAGAEIDARSRSGATPLVYAAGGRRSRAEGTAEKARMLLSHGADANAETRYGGRPLHLAASSGDLDVLLLLLDAGARTDVRDQSGFTPLTMAAIEGHLSVVNVLLAFYENDRAALDQAIVYARKRGHEAVALLIEQRAPRSAQ